MPAKREADEMGRLDPEYGHELQDESRQIFERIIEIRRLSGSPATDQIEGVDDVALRERRDITVPILDG